MKKSEVLDNHYFVEIISAVAFSSKEEEEKFNEELEQYEIDLGLWETNEELNTLRGISKPVKPVRQITAVYKNLTINFADLIIQDYLCYTDNEEEMVSVNGVSKSSLIPTSFSFKMSKEDWIKLLNDLGAFHNDSKNINSIQRKSRY